MNRRNMTVDFGLISLTMTGECALVERSGKNPEAGMAIGSAKLKRLLDGSAINVAQNGIMSDGEDHLKGDATLSVSPAHPYANAFTNASKLILGGSATAAVAVGFGVDVIRLSLRDEILPDTSLTVQCGEQRWIFSLYIGDKDTAHRLAKDIQLLALEVGPRLQKPLEIRLYTSDRSDVPLSAAYFDLESAR